MFGDVSMIVEALEIIFYAFKFSIKKGKVLLRLTHVKWFFELMLKNQVFSITNNLIFNQMNIFATKKTQHIFKMIQQRLTTLSQ